MADFSENIELSVLSCLLKDGSLYPMVEDILDPSSFGWKPFGIIYKSIQDIINGDLYPDTLTVRTDLERKGLLQAIIIPSNGIRGAETLKYIRDLDVNPDNIESYAFQVNELKGLRQLVELSDKMRRAVESGEKRPIEILYDMDMESGKIAAYVGYHSKNEKVAKEVALENLERFSSAVLGKNLYVKTGLRAWDDYVNGLYPERLYVVSARSNEGKSALIQNLIYRLSVEQGVKIKLFTLEMSAEDVQNRLVQIMTGISPLRIEKGELTEDELELFKTASGKISDSPILYDDSAELSLALLRTKIRKAVADGCKAIFIDQLEQIQIGGSGDKQEEYIKINYIAYRIKAFAREMSVPIVLVHQLNRSSEGSAKGQGETDLQLHMLAQGGEKAADAVLMIKNKDKTKFYWTKNRQGPKGMREVNWEGKRILFSDMSVSVNVPDFVQGTLPEEVM